MSMETGSIGQRMYRISAPCCDCAVRGDDFHKHEQGFARSKVRQNEVWKVFVYLDFEANGVCDVFISNYNFIPTLAQP